TTVAMSVAAPSVTRAAKPMPTTSVARINATITTFRWVTRLAASSEKLFMTRSPKISPSLVAARRREVQRRHATSGRISSATAGSAILPEPGLLPLRRSSNILEDPGLAGRCAVYVGAPDPDTTVPVLPIRFEPFDRLRRQMVGEPFPGD